VARVRHDYLSALLAADVPRARRVAETALREGMPVAELYLGVLQATLYEVGRLWQTGEGSVAQEHLATATTQALMARLNAGRDTVPSLEFRAITTATENDFHSLPPRFVADFLEADGWTVFDLGAATPTDALLDAITELRPVLVCLSTTLPANLPRARDAVAAVRALPAPPLLAVGGQAWNGDEELA
jgi:methanogenic corrinoid protein MtbC1